MKLLLYIKKQIITAGKNLRNWSCLGNLLLFSYRYNFGIHLFFFVFLTIFINKSALSTIFLENPDGDPTVEEAKMHYAGTFDSEGNVYRYSFFSGWSVDHPDGSTTIFAYGEPPIIPPRIQLEQAEDGSWYDPNAWESSSSFSSDTASDSSQKHTDSEHSSDTLNDFYEDNIDNRCSPLAIFNAYQSAIANVSSREELFYQSLAFMKHEFPHELLAPNEAEVLDPKSDFNDFLTTSRTLFGFENQEDYAHYHAAIYVYQGVQINPDITLDDPYHLEILSNIYFASVEKLLAED